MSVLARRLSPLLFVLAGATMVGALGSSPTTSVAAPPPTTVPDDTIPPNTEPTDPPQLTPTTIVPPVDEGGPLPDGDSLIPDPGVSEHPVFNHDLGYDEGAWNHLGRKTLGFFTEVGWTLNLAVVSIVLWFTGWAFRFDIMDILLGEGGSPGPLMQVAQAWNQEVVLGLGLNDVVWFLLITYVAANLMRGRGLHAAGEMMLSVLALGAAITIGANPAGYMQGGADTVRTTSGAVLAVSRGEPPSSDPSQASQIVDPIRAELFEVLVAEPHEIVNWGRPLTGACREASQAAIAEGPWGAADEPRDMMNAAGCDEAADFNHHPTAGRMFSAWMAAAVSIVVLALLALTVVTMISASLFFAVKFAFLFLALVGFQLPGSLREFAWGWLVGLLKHLMIVAGASMVISYLLLLMSAFLTAPGLGLAERFTLLLIATVSMFIYRKQLIAGVHHLTERLRMELGSMRIGLNYRGMGGWTGSAAIAGAAGATGYGIGKRSREALLDIPGNRAQHASMAGRMPYYRQQRYQRRRNGARARSR